MDTPNTYYNIQLLRDGQVSRLHGGFRMSQLEDSLTGAKDAFPRKMLQDGDKLFVLDQDGVHRASWSVEIPSPEVVVKRLS